MEKRTSSPAGLEVNKTCEAKPEIASFFMVLVVDRRPSCHMIRKTVKGTFLEVTCTKLKTIEITRADEGALSPLHQASLD